MFLLVILGSDLLSKYHQISAFWCVFVAKFALLEALLTISVHSVRKTLLFLEGFRYFTWFQFVFLSSQLTNSECKSRTQQ